MASIEDSMANLTIEIDPDLHDIPYNDSSNHARSSTLTPDLDNDDDEHEHNHVSDHEAPPATSLRPESPPPAQKKYESPQTTQFRVLADELLGHLDPMSAKATVILAPHGHQHIFSRPWVSKRYLSSIVERPERLNAAALGVGAARSVAPIHVVESTKRVSLFSDPFVKVHGKAWASELYSLCQDVAVKHAREELEVPESWPAGDIYLAAGTIGALEGALGAVERGVDVIYGNEIPAKRAFVAVRPPGHHCHEDSASGFCIMNNAHIAIQYARNAYGITHAVIMDFDLHHGDGSQDLLWKLGFKTDGPADIPMGYFSVHDINSFPCEIGYADKDKLTAASVCMMAHNTAVWNVHFQPYKNMSEFNKLYEQHYSSLFEKAAEFLERCLQEADGLFKPLIVISAGFDGSEYESQGMQRHNVNVPTSFFNRFTLDCIALAENYGTGHVLSLMEGGYSTAAISTGVLSHLTGLCGIPYQQDWCSPVIAREFDRATHKRWRPPQGVWSSVGMQLGRSLFPPPSPNQELAHPKERIFRKHGYSSAPNS